MKPAYSIATSPGLQGLRQLAFPWALALVTGIDYFDSALFSFFSSYIAGGINASTDELVWSASSYAIAAVIGILQQQWWVDRVGHRRYLAGSMFFYTLAAALTASVNSPIELMLTRGLQGYCVGPMMGACRILLQGPFPPQKAGPARRLFINAIVVASALAPLLGGVLLEHVGWRALFFCTAPVALLLCALCLLSVPDTGRLPREQLHPNRGHVWPYLAFAVGQGTLQIVLQQVHFQLFGGSPLLLILTLIGILALGAFGYHQWHHPQPLVKLSALREKAFLTGLSLYAIYYYLSTAFSYLTLRFLEGTLSYPIKSAGYFIGATSLVSLVTLAIYFRYSAKITQKKWLIVSGMVVAALTAWMMMRMPENASQAMLVPPLLMRGLLVLFIAIPVANMTFRGFEMEDFAHSYRLKNIIRQLMMSFSTSSIIVLEQHRQTLHVERLSESLNLDNPATLEWINGMQQHFAHLGYAAARAHEMALAEMGHVVTAQASTLALQDGFYFLIGVSAISGLFALWQKSIK